ncbi:Uncharacterized protein MK0369 [Methanopyrus kandleri AV19]|uniref:Uncharacterized protein n=1 Tax=Methanopyrus kandleri (strain AV19 / DSM 6324 / JCM 9639 / NBRC 100938) TaxID=190192 RepID=Q8TYD2_METKA|nr:Uncharacterized protein MK0369 [Methanopyrus kandleri AV19]
MRLWRLTAVMRLRNVMSRLVLALKEVEGGIIVGLLYDSN